MQRDVFLRGSGPLVVPVLLVLAVLGCGDDGAGDTGARDSGTAEPDSGERDEDRDAGGRDAAATECDPGWIGERCDVPAACAEVECDNGGRCELDANNEPVCDCAPGFEGERCETEPSSCAPNPCQNGGSCTMLSSDEYECECADGFVGVYCEQPATTHCVLTYTLDLGNGDDGAGFTGSNIRIRETALAIGDGTFAAGPGTLILRAESDGGSSAGPGPVEVLYMHLPQAFATDNAGIVVTTNVDAYSPTLGDDDNATALATGFLAFGAAPSIAWDDCSFPAGYNDTVTSYTPDVTGTGDGCLVPYRSVGVIHCDDQSTLANCSAGMLNDGDNAQDETWEQALETFTFSTDLGTFSMPFMQVPNRSASRTYISWGGTLVSTECE